MDKNEGISLHEKVEKIMETMRRSRMYACLGYPSRGKQDQTTVDDQPLPLKSDQRGVQRHGTVFPRRNRILTDGDRTAPNPLYIAPKSEWEVPVSVSLVSPVSSRPFPLLTITSSRLCCIRRATAWSEEASSPSSQSLSIYKGRWAATTTQGVSVRLTWKKRKERRRGGADHH